MVRCLTAATCQSFFARFLVTFAVELASNRMNPVLIKLVQPFPSGLFFVSESKVSHWRSLEEMDGCN